MSFPKIYYDGFDFEKYGTLECVSGYTTNTTIMRQGNKLNYKKFYEDNKSTINGKPISFQVFSDDNNTIIKQAREINSIGPNIYVKVPCVNSKNESLMDTIVLLLNENIKINITVVIMHQQLDSIYSYIKDIQTPTIVSVFGGRISDSGFNPKETIQYATNLFRENKNIEVLWAGCKDNLVIQNAKDTNCHIVTLPDAIISRINRLELPLEGLSQDIAKAFLKDGIEGQLSIL
jgi:transaldolase